MFTKSQIIEWKIRRLKAKLAETDYVSSKLAEANAKDVVFGTTEHTTAVYNEYADLIKQRDAWRDEINELEAQLNALRTEVQG